ncbi:MAG: hypothetical protein PVH89_04805 [Gammaproteobacteria bacterium]
MSFLGELKKRRVIQAAIAYAIVGWGVVEIVSTIEEPLGLPTWTDTLVIVLALIGFPLALVLSWIFDLTPTGIVRTEPSTEDEAPAKTGPATGDSTGTEDKREVLPNSIAVLPLENLSPNPDDAYFAAGIHEEILNYLAKIEDLSVIARTSVRRYAGTDKPIAEIAAELGVSTVMEGSVRYAGDRVRVTTQLIDAATENHLWSETYERELADVFAIQADIAMHVAAALRAELTTVEKRSIEELPTTRSSEAHALLLKSLALFTQGDTAMAVTTPPSVRHSIHTQLDRALELDPEFALPYALKALLYAVSRIYDPVTTEAWPAFCADLDESVRRNAQKALHLSPGLGIPHFALALNHQFNWQWRQARQDFERAADLRPNDAHLLTWYGAQELFLDNLDDAVRLARRAVALDPANAWAGLILGVILHMAGDYQASIASFADFSAMHPESSLPYLHRVLPEIALGNEDEALGQLQLADQLMPDEAAPAILLHTAYLYRRLGLLDEAQDAINRRKVLIGDRFVDPAAWVMGHLAQGDRAAALEALTDAVEQSESRQEVFVREFVRRNAWFDAVLDEPEFAAMRARLGAAD